MKDPIERQAAIDALDCISGVEEVLRSLPSAQPEKRTEECTETHACDLISRQAAIEAIAYSIELCNKALDSMTLGGRDRYAVEVERNSLLKLKDDFKLLPSAQPERKTGEWILSDVQNPEDVRNGNYTYTCSNCLHSDIHAKTAVVPFCWHCGADMSGADMREKN